MSKLVTLIACFSGFQRKTPHTQEAAATAAATAVTKTAAAAPAPSLFQEV